MKQEYTLLSLNEPGTWKLKKQNTSTLIVIHKLTLVLQILSIFWFNLMIYYSLAKYSRRLPIQNGVKPSPLIRQFYRKKFKFAEKKIILKDISSSVPLLLSELWQDLKKNYGYLRSRFRAEKKTKGSKKVLWYFLINLERSDCIK